MKTEAPKLTKIKLRLCQSEETPCFTATLEYKGERYEVSNQGRGGCNDYHPFLSRETEAELDEWAGENNPPHVMEGMPPLSMNFETWTFGKAFECA